VVNERMICHRTARASLALMQPANLRRQQSDLYWLLQTLSAQSNHAKPNGLGPVRRWGQNLLRSPRCNIDFAIMDHGKGMVHQAQPSHQAPHEAPRQVPLLVIIPRNDCSLNHCLASSRGRSSSLSLSECLPYYISYVI